MEIKPISPEEWAGFIENRPESSVFESPTYFKPFDLDENRLFLAGGFSDNKLKLVFVGSLQRKSHLNLCLSLPTFSFGKAPLIDSDQEAINFNEVVEQMDSFLKKSKIVEVIGYTDNENVARELSNKDFRVEENTVAFIDLNKEMDTLFAALKSPNRRAIKKATKSGVEARKEESESILPEIFDLLRDNAETRGYSIFDQKDFIKRISSYMKEGMCDIWTARKNEQILSCLVTYHDKTDAYAVFGASIKSAQQLRPNNLLHWNALDYYKNHGYKKYYMGFIKSYEPFGKEITGYGEFKLKFRPELVPHYRYMKIYKKKTYMLSRVLDKVKK